MGSVAGAIIGGVGSIAGGLIGASGAKKAAKTGMEAQQAGYDAQLQIYMQQRADLMPWLEAGRWALGNEATTGKDINALKRHRRRLQNELAELGTSQQPGLNYNKTTKTQEGTLKRLFERGLVEYPSLTNEQTDKSNKLRQEIADLTRQIKAGPQQGTGLVGMVERGPGEFVPEEQPGYQFGYEEFIEKPTLRSAAAAGRSRSGATQKALTRYASNYASQEYDKWLSRYYDKLKPYQSLAGVGQTSAATMASMAPGYPNMAPYAYGGQMNQTNALLAGLSGATNAFQGGLNWYQMQNMLNQGGRGYNNLMWNPRQQGNIGYQSPWGIYGR